MTNQSNQPTLASLLGVLQPAVTTRRRPIPLHYGGTVIYVEPAPSAPPKKIEENVLPDFTSGFPSIANIEMLTP